MDPPAVVLGLAVLALLVLAAEYRYAQRKRRTLPASITDQLAGFEITRGRFKRVDMVMEDGRSFEGVWVVDDQWPTFSLRRAIHGFKAQRIVSVREHVERPSDS